MPIDQAVLDHRVVGGVPATEETRAQIDVIVVAARRDMIDASLQPAARGRPASRSGSTSPRSG